ncbi:hypothetical protein G7084_05835 [Weissella coleopterorum]|uniref:Competence protein n=1 Tax=Weissella coleopterorum TaxID=2714949 RepID=A0A6G8B0P3_9LACO|nr:competence protein CoiA family protein [Weissella coleopterorum]QIL50878.1 hypothetical protein G7084_05835 [Weissella coleopterorum]
MLFARDQQSQAIVHAKQAQRFVIYQCLDCQQQVHLKSGPVRHPYFAHMRLLDCGIFSENETFEHVLGKYHLLAYFSKKGYRVELEKYLINLKQRPDLMIHRDKLENFAIEYQCAPISLGKLNSRCRGYQQNGIKVRWILGKPYQNKNLQAGTWAKFAQPISSNTIGVTFWSTKQRRLLVRPWIKIDGRSNDQKNVSNDVLANRQLGQLIRASRTFNPLNNRLYQMHRFLWGIP